MLVITTKCSPEILNLFWWQIHVIEIFSTISCNLVPRLFPLVALPSFPPQEGRAWERSCISCRFQWLQYGDTHGQYQIMVNTKYIYTYGSERTILNVSTVFICQLQMYRNVLGRFYATAASVKGE